MKLYVIDTNVIVLAGAKVGNVPYEQLACYQKCNVFLNELMKTNACVLVDREGRVINEYESHYRLNAYPNMAYEFFVYAMAHLEYYELKELSKDKFDKYPDNEKLQRFDPPDRKFIALAYGYGNGVPIVEAIDSKWWGIKEELKNVGIELILIDEDYIKTKWKVKMS